jgi:hypothetical protein
MADASRPSNPPGWSDVFAALPLEAPPISRWPELAAHLDNQRNTAAPPGRRRNWLALAASLFALAALPAAWMLRDAPADASRAQPSITASTVPTTPVSTASVSTAASSGDAAPRDDVMPGIDPGSSAVATIHNLAAAPRIAVATHATSPLPAVNTRRKPARERLLATRTANTASNRADDTASLESLEALYAASAQLETLLTFARDTRVESAPAAALAGTFDAELATIDAQLAQPGLGTSQQLMLWQARVETLQRSAGFESHLRLLAANGERLDGALVSID